MFPDENRRVCSILISMESNLSDNLQSTLYYFHHISNYFFLKANTVTRMENIISTFVIHSRHSFISQLDLYKISTLVSVP